MMKQVCDDYYVDELGDVVFTSDYYRKRGSCCKSNCLHCPYGTTLKNIGVKLISYTDSPEIVQKTLDQFKVSSVTDSLLDDAFGKQAYRPKEQAYLITLKDKSCGIVFIENQKVVEVKLLSQFSKQGIDESYINSLL